MPNNGSSACSLDMTGYEHYYQGGLYDSSAGCYVTDYLLSACLLCGAVYLLKKHTAKADKFIEHTRLWIVGKFLFTAMATGMAATVHQGLFATAGDIESGVNRLIWVYVVEAGSILGGACLFCACFSLLTTEDTTKRNSYLYCGVFSASILAICALMQIFGDDYFIVTGVLGDLFPGTVLALCLVVGSFFLGHEQHRQGHFVFGATYMWVAIALIWLGSAIQVLLGPSCGVPCPETCIFPAPVFNHNAVFHSIWIVAYSIMAFGVHHACSSLENEAILIKAVSKAGFLDAKKNPSQKHWMLVRKHTAMTLPQSP